MSLKVVTKKSGELPNTARYVNERLEAETLGFPLWLHKNGYHEQALEAMRIIGEYPQDTFMSRPHRFLQFAFDVLGTMGVSPSIGRLQAGLMQNDWWTEDESDRSRVTPGLLAELEELGCLKLTVTYGLSIEDTLRERLIFLADMRRKRNSIVQTEQLLLAMENWHQGNDRDITSALDELNTCFGERFGKRAMARSIEDLVNEDLAALERQANGEEPRRIMTGFRGLDNALGGMLPGNVIVVAGRPGMGKTALSLDIALDAAKRGDPTVYFSLEMGSTEIMRRIASKEARINVLRMRHGELQHQELNTYRNTGVDLANILLWIDDGDSHTPGAIEARIRDLNRTGTKIQLAVIDHLGLLAGRGGPNESRYTLIGNHTAAVKRMARALDVTVLLLCQLNRNPEHRDDKSPKLSDLRDSGSIEQDADVVFGVYRRNQDTRADEDANHAEIHILKNRSGPVGTAELKWIPELAKFINPLVPRDTTEVESLEDAPF